MRPIALLFILAAAGCSTSPANVAGDYTVAVTNHENGCNLAMWTVGDSRTGIPVTVTQNGSAAMATITGVVGGAVSLWLGSNVFSGNVDGAHMTMTLIGTTAQHQGNCTYTYNAALDADLMGNTLEGTIAYEARTNNNPDCAPLVGCRSEQAFNGTRPPQ